MTPTLEALRQSAERAEAEYHAAQREQHDAHEALAALRGSEPREAPRNLSVEEAKERDRAATAAQLAARNRVARADVEVPLAERRAREMRERFDKLAPHADVLERLDKAMAEVRAKDAATTALAEEFTARLARSVGEVTRAIGFAHAIFHSLPLSVRSELSSPISAAEDWGVTTPSAPGLLSLLDAAAWRKRARASLLADRVSPPPSPIHPNGAKRANGAVK